MCATARLSISQVWFGLVVNVTSSAMPARRHRSRLPVLLGRRSLDELRDAYSDVIAWGEAEALLKALFPARHSQVLWLALLASSILMAAFGRRASNVLYKMRGIGAGLACSAVPQRLVGQDHRAATGGLTVGQFQSLQRSPLLEQPLALAGQHRVN